MFGCGGALPLCRLGRKVRPSEGLRRLKPWPANGSPRRTHMR